MAGDTTFTVKIRPERVYDALFTLSYYSHTFDVIAFTGSDEEYEGNIVASFASLVDATAYARATDAYALVRPPSDVRDAGIAWLRFVCDASTDEGTKVTRYGALR